MTGAAFDPETRIAPSLRRISRVCGAGVLTIGVMALVGWTFDIPTLKSGLPWFLPMKANTALLFIPLGASLWCARRGESARGRRACALVVIVLSTLTGFEYVTGVDLGIDELLFRDPAREAALPGRMAPATAVSFLLLGLAVFFIDVGRRVRPSDIAAVFAGVIAFVSLCGYLYGAPPLRVGPYAPTSLLSTVGLLAAFLGFLLARPGEGLTAGLASDTTAGAMMRRMLPVVVVMLPALALLRLRGQVAGLYDTTVGVAILSALIVMMFIVVISVTCASLNRSELACRRVQANLIAREQEIEITLDSIGDAVIATDADGRIVRMNPVAEWLTGWSASEAASKPLPEVFRILDEETRQVVESPAERVLREGRIVDLAKRALLVSRDGSERPISDSGAPIRKGAAISGVVLVFRDISAERTVEKLLQDSEAKYRDLYEHAPYMYVSVDAATARIRKCNRAVVQNLGYAQEELVGRSIFDFYHPDCVETARAAFESFRDTGRVDDVELALRRKDGGQVDISLGITAIRDEEGRILRGRTVWRDITDRKRAERDREELLIQRGAAERLGERNRFFELSRDLVCIADPQGRFLQVNPAFSRTLGYPEQELLERPFIDFVHPDDRPATLREAEEISSSGVMTVDFSNRYRCKDGSYRWLQWSSVAQGDGTHYAVARDITRDRELLEALQKREVSLTASLKEREVLLQEVHHRVKNNLQVISSLINMQARQLGDGAALSALEECKTRVGAIALIHEKLYQAKDHARVPFAEYARTLAGNVFHATGISPATVVLEVDIENVALTVEKAIPCGLILNELITNALKHAFPGERHGVVHVELRRNDGHLILAVADDGVGMPPDLDLAASNSLGMQLVSTLVDQLEGRLDIARAEGTAVRIAFPAESQA